MLTTIQKVKETILITLLNIALPIVDIYTDLAETSNLYSGYLSHEDCDERRELEPFGLIPGLDSTGFNTVPQRGSTTPLIQDGQPPY